MQWSPQQKKVIETRDKNILVSAAAGSGKTAVLVERIIQKILRDGKNVDRMLVVTFTNAAAGEMRERVLKAIEDELERQPENVHLQKQQSYIHNAHITTIHSFCLELLREHYLELQLDPGFQVGDTNEMELMKGEVLEELLEQEYESARPEFLNFVNQFMVRNSDKPIEAMILDLYEEAMGYPWPEQWLEESISIYQIQTEEAFYQTRHFQCLLQTGDELLEYAITKCQNAIALCNRADGPAKYIDVLQEDYDNLLQTFRQREYEGRSTSLQFSFPPLPRVGKTEASEAVKKQVQELRKQVKAIVGEAQQLYQVPVKTMLEELQSIEPIAREYVRLTKAFRTAFLEKKRSKNVVDFTDFEHYAVQILAKHENGTIVPTRTAEVLAEFYDDVMIDEYQDSNHIQETILSMISKERQGIHNRFMVGDVKQSIYGFRGAKPDIFVDKYNRFTLYGGKEFDEAKYLPDESNVKIILDKNFRSRNQVLQFTNVVFRQMMSRDFGGICYDEENQLNTGADYADTGEDYNCEWLFLEERETENSKQSENQKGEKVSEEEKSEKKEKEEWMLPQHEMEAMAIAERIKELTDENHGLQIRDKKNGEYRRAKYSDIVILSRGLDDVSYVLHDILNRQGIPCYMESKKGYFDTIEIRTILNFLKLLDNPRQDIPMAGILKSPIGGFGDEELAVIRVVSNSIKMEGRTLYDDLKYFSKGCEGNEGAWLKHKGMEGLLELQGKISRFLDLLERFRKLVNHTSIYELITKFLEETGYYYYIMAMPAGARRKMNVDMLKERAAAYENGIYKGLFYFVRYIEKMQQVNLDMGEASTLSETDNTVRIMTIHKSKGLEFPIVFLCNIGKSFNFRDSQGKYVMHSDLGVGLDYLQQDIPVRKKTMVKKVIERQLKLDVVQEELRLLYVACTRAKEKLILVHQPVTEKKIQSLLEHGMYQEELLPRALRASVKSYFDIIGAALCRNQAFQELYQEFQWELPVDNPFYQETFYVTVKRISVETLEQQILKDIYVQESNEIGLETSGDNAEEQELARCLTERFTYQYPYQRAVHSYGKMSVSDIKKLADTSEESQDTKELILDMVPVSEAGEQEPAIPMFMQAERHLTGANRGTVYHRVFEWFDYHIIHETRESIHEMLNAMEARGHLTAEERSCVFEPDFLAFAGSSLGRRMQNAFLRGQLYREAQFVLGLTKEEIMEYEAAAKGDSGIVPECTENSEEDIVLVQGIIDAYFIEDGKIVVVDYKTDHVSEPEELRRRYSIQLALYARALEQLTELEVTEKLLYSTKLRQVVEV